MNEPTRKEPNADIHARRQQVSQQRQDSEDYLEVLEARRRSIAKPRLTQKQVEKRYAIK